LPTPIRADRHLTVLDGAGNLIGLHGADRLPAGCPLALGAAAIGRPWHAACVAAATPAWAPAVAGLQAAVAAVRDGREPEVAIDLAPAPGDEPAVRLSARVSALGPAPGACVAVAVERAGADASTVGDPELAAVFDAMEEGVLVWGPDGRVCAANRSAERILSVSRATLLDMGQTDPRIAAYDTDGSVLPVEARAGAVARKTGRPSSRRVMGVHVPGGRMRWISVNSQPMYRPGEDEPYGVVSMFGDITEHRRTEERYRALVDRSVDVTTIVDASGHIRFVSAAVERMVGWAPADLVGRPASDFIHPDDRPGVHDAFGNAVRGGRDPGRFTCRFRAADGDWRVLEMQATPIAEPDGAAGLQVSARDVTDRLRAEREVRKLSARLAGLVEGVPIGIVLEDEDRQVAMVNRAVSEIFDTPLAPEGVLGRDAVAGLRAASRALARPDGFLARIDDVVAAGLPVFGEEIPFADGRVVLRDYVPIRDADGHLGHVWLFRDVSAERRAAEELRAVRDEAVAATRAKSDFVATMSHEIRTPLNAIVGAVELLADTDLTAEQGELAAMVREAGTGLRAIIEDILDFSRIEAGKLPVRAREFSVRDLLGGVRDVVRPALAGRPLVLHATVDDAVPDRLVGDADRLRQILINLAGNAVKFTRHGTVGIRARLGARRGDAVELVLEVADTGPGIAPAERERLFQPFTQLDGSATRSHGGTGLGLAITLRLVELLGGAIELDSSPGSGSTFRVGVPLRVSPHGAPPTAAAPAPALAGRALLADDNDVNRRVIRRQLERLGLTVTAVPGGREAIDAAAGERFDVILMDCRMPHVDGYSATRAIRAAEPPRARTPILAITANALPEDCERCHAAGMDGIVTKPVTIEALRERLADAMPTSPIDGGVLDRLREELADDALLASVAHRYAGELAGRRAALVRAHAAGDTGALADAAHVLASPSETLGLVRLGALCRAVERDPARADAVAEVEREIARAAAAVPELLARAGAAGAS
jgi:PAS domain S-box-containing protein